MKRIISRLTSSIQGYRKSYQGIRRTKRFRNLSRYLRSDNDVNKARKLLSEKHKKHRNHVSVEELVCSLGSETHRDRAMEILHWILYRENNVDVIENIFTCLVKELPNLRIRGNNLSHGQLRGWTTLLNVYCFCSAEISNSDKMNILFLRKMDELVEDLRFRATLSQDAPNMLKKKHQMRLCCHLYFGLMKFTRSLSSVKKNCHSDDAKLAQDLFEKIIRMMKDEIHLVEVSFYYRGHDENKTFDKMTITYRGKEVMSSDNYEMMRLYFFFISDVIISNDRNYPCSLEWAVGNLLSVFMSLNRGNLDVLVSKNVLQALCSVAMNSKSNVNLLWSVFIMKRLTKISVECAYIIRKYLISKDVCPSELFDIEGVKDEDYFEKSVKLILKLRSIIEKKKGNTLFNLRMKQMKKLKNSEKSFVRVICQKN